MDNTAKDYSEYTDEELVLMYRNGDFIAEEQLYSRYKSFVSMKARSYFLLGSDREDLIQEGMIGFFKAIRDYNPQKQAAFKSFAELCIVRQIITAIKGATRQKHIPLNTYVSLNKPIYDDEYSPTLLETLPGSVSPNPEELLIVNEDYENIKLRLNEILSELEQKTLTLFLEGCSYTEISQALGRPSKTVDNALQRIKRKLQKYLDIKPTSLR